VVIIGAGLAGLTAALDLVGAGWDVVVFEARPRVGGRVHTVRSPFSPGLHAEAGGESIDDNHDQLQAMIARFGLRTERRPIQKLVDARVHYRGRSAVMAAFLANRGGKVLLDYLRFGNALDAFSGGVDPMYPERARNAESIDRRSVEDFIRSLGLVPEAEFLVRTQTRGEYNAEPRDVSLLFAAQQAKVLANVPITATETMRIAGGNSQLPAAMAAALGRRIRLGTPVREVEHGPSGVRVHAANGPPVDAASIVVAAPLHPMRRVRFSPPLPASVAAMVEGLSLGAAVKVIREYTLPFWSAELLSGFTVTDLPFAIGWSPTDSYVAVPGLLSQFITGDAAVAAAQMSDVTRYRAFQAQLDRVYPEGSLLLTGRHASLAWPDEPYTGGGYAVFQPGQMAPFWPILRDGYQRIRFAGEHTEPLAGYMESAVRSGHRVATALGKPPA
jgi:monoamine oxidase